MPPIPTGPRPTRLALMLLVALATPALAAPTHDPTAPRDPVVFDTVYVRGLQPTSLPTRIPTTTAGVTRAEIETQVNATDAEDALKYLPSLLVRKRYIGDYDHAVLATRASGTNNSARSLVYADGILLSNLLGNGATFTPRWGLVNPEAIERVDVLYGPFSAAYSGNSVGAVVDYVTRMPQRQEVHAKLGYSLEHFRLYGTDESYPATSVSASIGERRGRLSAWLSVARVDSHGHPIAFASVTPGVNERASGTAVTGAVQDLNTKGAPWAIVGAYGQTDTRQDQARLKLAYDITDDLRLSYTLGVWRNHAQRDAESYLRDAAGRAVYAGTVGMDGRFYDIGATALAPTRSEQLHRIHGLALKRHTGKAFDFGIVASRYRYVRDLTRSPTVALPAASNGGAGRLADASGTGWTTFSAAVTWRPDRAHTIEAGLQDDAYRLATTVYATPDWIRGGAGPRVSAFGGEASLRSAYVQDAWTMSPRWTAMLGLRGERWSARDGHLATATADTPYQPRGASDLSPKAALQFRLSADATLKASVGRAVRYPTVSELFQGSTTTNETVINEPDLTPETSVTSEVSYVRSVSLGRVRATYFRETTHDALYSQTNARNVTSVQNVGLIRTDGVELATELTGVGLENLDVNASLTFADSIIERNAGLPSSEGKWQPRVPRWRGNLVAVYHPGSHWSFTGAARYSGRQFNTLDNSDVNSHTYFGTSPFLVVDTRARYRHDAHWSAAAGVDNVGNRTYWNFHPYNQRTWTLEVRYDD